MCDIGVSRMATIDGTFGDDGRGGADVAAGRDRISDFLRADGGRIPEPLAGVVMLAAGGFVP